MIIEIRKDETFMLYRDEEVKVGQIVEEMFMAFLAEFKVREVYKAGNQWVALTNKIGWKTKWKS